MNEYVAGVFSFEENMCVIPLLGWCFSRRVAEGWIGVWRYEGTEVEDRGIWFEDREVGMECWWCVDLRIYESMGIKKAEGSCEFLRFLCGGYLLSHLRSTIGVTGLNFSVRNG